MEIKDVKLPGTALRTAVAAYDELFVRALGGFLLEQEGFAGGAGYLLGSGLLRDLTNSVQYDLLLLDEQLKDMTAKEFLHKLGQLGLIRRPVVIVLVRGGYGADWLSLTECGADRCLRFPRDPRLLVQSIRSVCSGRARMEEAFRQLYRRWDVEDLTANCAYLTAAAVLFLEKRSEVPLRKQVFSEVAAAYRTSLPAVESSLQRLIGQMARRDTEAYRAFVSRHGLEKRGLTPLRLVKATAQEAEQSMAAEGKWT